MRLIDELQLKHPFAGARMLRDMLKLEGVEIGRKHVSTLMKKMGIEALYRKSNTSRRDLSLSAARPHDRPSESGLGDGYDVHPDESWLHLFDGRPRLGNAACARLRS